MKALSQQDNIRMDQGVKWIEVSQDTAQWWALVKHSNGILGSIKCGRNFSITFSRRALLLIDYVISTDVTNLGADQHQGASIY
jgi:hypothetical protein